MTEDPIARLNAVALLVAFPGAASAQRQQDVAAINDLIDRYGATEDASDMTAQAALMSPDRVWIAAGAGRRTDNAANMRIQQAGMDAFEEEVPGIRYFTEDRDRLIRFHGDGSVAIASFYRYQTAIVPADAPPDVAAALGSIPPSAITLVLEKRDGAWRIVHTHVSPLFADGG